MGMGIWDIMDNGNGRCHPYRGGVLKLRLDAERYMMFYRVWDVGFMAYDMMI